MKTTTRILVAVALREAASALAEEGRHNRAGACNAALREMDSDPEPAPEALKNARHWMTRVASDHRDFGLVLEETREGLAKACLALGGQP